MNGPAAHRLVFPDHGALTSSDGCRLRPGRPLGAPVPAIVPTVPADGFACCLYGTVLHDPGEDRRYTMWYQAMIEDYGDAVCRAVSQDGIEWRRIDRTSAAPAPEIAGLALDQRYSAEAAGFPGPNNIAAWLHDPVVFGPNDGDAYPGLYKIFGFTDEGYAVGFSRDGIDFHFARDPALPLMCTKDPNTGKSWFSDVGIPFWDGRRGAYVGLIKTYELDDAGRTRRCIGFCESDDLLHWSELRTIWRPGEEADEIAHAEGFAWADLYGMPTVLHGRGYLGILWLFRIHSELPKGTNLGKLQVYLASSRDAIHWSLVSREPLIANPPDGELGCGCICTGSRPLSLPDREIIYFGAEDALHGAWEIGLPPIGPHPPTVCSLSFPKDGLCRIWADDGLFVLPLSELGTERAEMIEVRTSSDGAGSRIAIDLLDGAEPTRIFDAEPSEAQLISAPIHQESERAALRFRLHRAGVYSIEARAARR